MRRAGAGIAGALLAVTSAAWAGPAQAVAPCSPNEGCLVVQVMGGVGDQQVTDSVVVQPQMLDDRTPPPDSPDVGANSYQTLYPNGSTFLQDFNDATSVRELLRRELPGSGQYASIDHVLINRPIGASGNSSLSNTLTAADLNLDGAGGTWERAGEVPLFFTRQTGEINYLRPQHDDSDVNGRDFYTSQESTGVPIVVQVYLRSAQAVKPVVVTASKKVAAGSGVPFGVAYDGAPPSEQPTELHYFWSFDTGNPPNCTDADPADSLGPSPRHTFTAAGSYFVAVTVCGERSSGTSERITMTVGPRSKPIKGPKRGGPGPKGNPTKGPDRGPNHGPGDKLGGPDGPDGTGGDGDASTRGTTGRRSTQREASGGKKNLALASDGQTVSGVLLDADAAKAVTIRSADAAPVVGASTRRATALPMNWRWLLALLPLVLLLGGVARQTPWLAARLPRPPWRDV